MCKPLLPSRQSKSSNTIKAGKMPKLPPPPLPPLRNMKQLNQPKDQAEVERDMKNVLTVSAVKRKEVKVHKDDDRSSIFGSVARTESTMSLELFTYGRPFSSTSSDPEVKLY